jgi:DNA replication and repair protein RecF
LREAARTNRASDASVAIWEPPLAEHGAVLWAERRAWAASVEMRFQELCSEIGESGRARLRYASSVNGSDDLARSLASALEERRPLDLRRGLTHVGPHRDDLTIMLAGPDNTPRDLRTFGSAGQQRSAAIALRMLEASTFRERTGRAPVFLLDDPFAELDSRRASRVLSVLTRERMGQTILAVPRESDIPSELTNLERFRVADGEIARHVFA